MKKFYKSTGVLFIAAGISAVLSFLFYKIANFITVEEFGVFTSLLELIYVIGLMQNALVNYITKLVATRNISSDEVKSKTIKLFKAQALVSILFVTVGIVFIKELFRLDGIWEIVALVPFIMTALVISLHRGILRGREQFVYLGWVSVVEAGIKLVMGLTAAYLGLGVVGILLAIGVTEIIIYILLVTLTKKGHIKDNDQNLNKFTEKVFGPTAISFVLVNIIFVVDGLLARYNLSGTNAGLYGGLITFGKLIFFLSSTIVVTMFPLSVKSQSRNKILKSAIFMVLVLTGAVTIGYYVLGELIVKLVLGKEYIVLVKYLPIESLLIGIYTLINVSVTFLVAKNTKYLNHLLGFGITLFVGGLWFFGHDLQSILWVRGIGYSVILVGLSIWAIISFKNKNYVL